jgi:hypothetical protein
MQPSEDTIIRAIKGISTSGYHAYPPDPDNVADNVSKFVLQQNLISYHNKDDYPEITFLREKNHLRIKTNRNSLRENSKLLSEFSLGCQK